MMSGSHLSQEKSLLQTKYIQVTKKFSERKQAHVGMEP